jgi:hypothetical protein
MPTVTRLYRTVDDDELADIARTGRYRTLQIHEGKSFFPTARQASMFARLIYTVTSAPTTMTSVEIDVATLRAAEEFEPVGEGPAWFLRVLPKGRPTVHNSMLI